MKQNSKIVDCPYCDEGCCFCDYSSKIRVGEDEEITETTYRLLVETREEILSDEKINPKQNNQRRIALSF